MATTMRLTRMGKKKRPFYRLVLLDSRKRRDGAYLANLGYYNPFVEPHEVNLHEEEILSWLQKGATVSDTARSLLRSQGILYRFSLLRKGLKSEEIEQQMTSWQEGSAERERRLATKRAEQTRAEAAARAKEEAERDAAQAEADAAPEETAADQEEDKKAGAEVAAEPAADVAEETPPAVNENATGKDES